MPKMVKVKPTKKPVKPVKMACGGMVKKGK